jgi:hypothetical protein
LVTVYDSHHDRKTFKKFLRKRFGPYMVMKVFYDNNTNELVHLHGTIRKVECSSLYYLTVES